MQLGQDDDDDDSRLQVANCCLWLELDQLFACFLLKTRTTHLVIGIASATE